MLSISESHDPNFLLLALTLSPIFGPSAWNKLRLSLCQTPTLSMFKSNLKTHLLISHIYRSFLSPVGVKHQLSIHVRAWTVCMLMFVYLANVTGWLRVSMLWIVLIKIQRHISSLRMIDMIVIITVGWHCCSGDQQRLRDPSHPQHLVELHTLRCRPGWDAQQLQGLCTKLWPSCELMEHVS